MKRRCEYIVLAGLVAVLLYQIAHLGTEVSQPPRTVIATISTNLPNRNGWTAISKGIEYGYFMANPVVLWSHFGEKYPIGRVLKIEVRERRVLAMIQFSDTPEGRYVYQRVMAGDLSAWSVGLIPLVYEPLPGGHPFRPNYLIRRWELVELSLVTVPANPECLVHRWMDRL